MLDDDLARRAMALLGNRARGVPDPEDAEEVVRALALVAGGEPGVPTWRRRLGAVLPRPVRAFVHRLRDRARAHR